MILRLKNFIEVLPFTWGYLEFFFLGEGGDKG